MQFWYMASCDILLGIFFNFGQVVQDEIFLAMVAKMFSRAEPFELVECIIENHMKLF